MSIPEYNISLSKEDESDAWLQMHRNSAKSDFGDKDNAYCSQGQIKGIQSAPFETRFLNKMMLEAA